MNTTQHTQVGRDAVATIVAMEEGTLPNEEAIAFMQSLLDAGMPWQTNGPYAQLAAVMIAEGLLHPQTLQ